jgi:hypothetical protein
MANIHKFSLVLLGILFAGSLLLPLNASEEPTIDSPPYPSFTVNLVSNSYIAEAVIDPYNGSIITPSHRVTDYRINVNITNIHGHYKEVYYILRISGFYETGYSEERSILASDSEYTIFSLPANYRAGDKINIQIYTKIVYEYTTLGDSMIPNQPSPTIVTATAFKEGYISPIQTFTMPDTSTPSTTSTLSTPETAAPDNTPIAATIIILTIIILAVALMIKRKAAPSPTENLTSH